MTAAIKKEFSTVNPVVVGVIQELLISVVREMRVTFSRSAFSPIITEGHDFSCALHSDDGELLAMSEDNPSHIFPLAYAAGVIKKRYGDDIGPGDIFIINDPYLGTHMNDVALICPRFGEGEALIYPAIRAHWGDVGGAVPGSLSGNASHLFQEGVRIPGLALYRGGKVNQEVLDLLLSNMRNPDERMGDLNAMIGTATLATRRLVELEKRYGIDTMAQVSQVLRNRTEGRIRNAIKKWPEGIYYYENYLDNSGTDAEPLRISLALTVKSGHIHCDFTGTSPQVRGPNNGSLATTAAACLIPLKTFLDPKAPVNGGAFRALELTAPEGSVVNAKFPSPMGGFSETRRATEATLMGAIAKIIPEQSCGEVKSSANHCYVNGTNPATDRNFTYYEYPAGGTGGVKGVDGEDAVRGYAEGDFNTVLPVESLERLNPMLVEATSLRPDSAGPGKWRGGYGMERRVRIECADATLSVLADRVIIPPSGVNKGQSAHGNRFTVYRDGKQVEPDGLPGKVTSFGLKPNDVLCLRSGGGGGFGDPLERDPHAVLHDVVTEVLTAEAARTAYGVVVKNGTIDFEATLTERKRMMENRVHMKVVVVNDDRYVGVRRICEISPQFAERTGLKQSQLIEYVPASGWPLRAFVYINSDLQGEQTRLGPKGASILSVRSGDMIRIRPIYSPYSHPDLPA